MRVAIDVRPAVSAGMTGIGFYTRYLLELLPEVDPAATYVAWYLNAKAILKPIHRRRFFSNIAGLVERATPFPARLFERLSERFELPRVEWFTRFDVLFAPNFLPPPTKTRRLVLTIHDLAFRKFPETAPAATLRWLGRLDRALEQAAEIIAVSEHTKADLCELYPVEPDRVTVIPHGVDTNVFHPPLPEEVERVRRTLEIEGPYLVFLGGIEPRKNLPALVRAFAKLPARFQHTLVIAGASVPWNPEGVDQLRPVVEELRREARQRIVFAGYLSDENKVALLGGARALVFPSRYEGFGLPVLEAMACGTPVLTSNVSALPEVAGDAAVLVDPTDEDSIAWGIQLILGNEEHRERLRQQGFRRAAQFDWRETARRTAAVLHRAAKA
ncbi:MAG: glycosyltransferase family 4 protein [Actinomycetota bacterium]